MLNLTIKIRLHLQKSSHLDLSPEIAIFVLSCKEIRRPRRQNGQAGARPCRMTVGDAGTEAEKPSQFVDIHRAYIRAEAPLSRTFQSPFGDFFCERICAKKKKILICISTSYNRIYDLPPKQSCSDKSTFRTSQFGFFHRNVYYIDKL